MKTNKYHVQYFKVFKYLVQYLVFKYYLNTAKSKVVHKVFKNFGQSICPNTFNSSIFSSHHSSLQFQDDN